MQDDPPVDSAQRPAVELNAPSPLQDHDPVSPDSPRAAGGQDASLAGENEVDGASGQADASGERGVGKEEAKATNANVDGGAGLADAAGSQGKVSEVVKGGQTAGAHGEEASAGEDGQISGSSIEASAGGEEDRKESSASDGSATEGTKESGNDGAATEPGTAPSAPTLVEPKPSNPLTATSSLLHAPSERSGSPAASNGSAPAAARAIASAGTGASPAPSVSPGPTSTSAASTPQPTKKFQSSLAVNKKFLEKAGEKAKPEVKPVTSEPKHSSSSLVAKLTLALQARLATPPAPAPSSTSHPRLFAGKLSSGPITLSTSSTAASSGWSKKSTAPTPSTAATQSGTPASAPTAGSGASAARAKAGAVWAAPKPAQPATPFGARMANDFPTAAEAAHGAFLMRLQDRRRVC